MSAGSQRNANPHRPRVEWRPWNATRDRVNEFGDPVVYPGSFTLADWRVNLPVDSVTAGGSVVGPWAQQAIFDKYILALGEWEGYEQINKNIEVIDEAVRLGTELHQSHLYDFHGWYIYLDRSSPEADEIMTIVLVYDEVGGGQPDPQPKHPVVPDECDDDGAWGSDDPTWCDTTPDEWGEGGPWHESFDADDGNNAISEPRELEDSDSEDDDEDEGEGEGDDEEEEEEAEDENKTGGSKIIDGCLPTLYLNIDDLALLQLNEFVNNVVAQAGVDRASTMLSVSPRLTVGSRWG